MTTKKRCLTGEYVVSSSICPPAVRTVSLYVYGSEPNEEQRIFRDIIPVLAIETKIVETYVKYTYSPEESSLRESNREELLDAGYHFHSRTRDLNAIQVSSDGLEAIHGLESGSIWTSKLVVCPWNTADDAFKFEPIFKVLEKDLKSMIDQAARIRARAEALRNGTTP